MKEAYYFSHDANARTDDKILELRSEFGWHGYGLFWAIIETLRDCSNYSYPSNATAGLALSLNIAKADLETFINKCIELRLFVEEDGVFFSESLMRRMEQVDEKRRKRAEAGRIGGIAKAKAKQSPSNALAKASKEKKVKESKVKENTTPSGSGEPKERHALLEMFEEITGRKFQVMSAKTERQFKLLRKTFEFEDFRTAIKNGYASSQRWDDPNNFTPEYITREDKFLQFYNWGNPGKPVQPEPTKKQMVY